MPTLQGPYERISFLGATVVNFDVSVGWNEAGTVLTVTLVEDDRVGDFYAPPGDGEPVVFRAGDFKFEGILRNQERVEDFSGVRYRASVVDPRTILAGVPVLLGVFSGATSAVPNLLNAYGYWENKLGFGGAMSNDSGMLWQAPYDVLGVDPSAGGGLTLTQEGWVGIKPALEAMTAQAGDYGGPIRYMGHSYRLDLSGLPTPPGYYRIGGVSVTVLELITTLCQDAGCDYLCYLDGDVIRFRAVSLATQPSLGQVANFAMSETGVVSRSYGTEMRDGDTNAVLFGGPVRTLQQVYNFDRGTTIWPYWGEDAKGDVILGHGPPEGSHTFALNASEIADIVGGVEYPCSIPELRLALMDYESWASYLIRWERDKADTIGLVSTVDATSDLQSLFPDVMFRRDLIAMRDEDLQRYGAMNEEDYWTTRASRVYDFVRSYASEYFGRKFLVRIPFFLYWKFIPETTALVSSDEVADSAYAPEGSLPLGLGFGDIDLFLTEEGLFSCFVAFPLDEDMDLMRLQPGSYVVSGGQVYVRATADPRIVSVPGEIYPYCVVTLEDAIYEAMPDPLGGLAEIATLLDVDVSLVTSMAAVRHGSFPVRIAPPPYRPSAVALPMKSNRSCYGPWGTFPGGGGTPGPPGKVYVEHDESLTPWNYGDWATMNAAAEARLAGAATAQQRGETGSVTIAGLPTINPGDSLVAGGPSVTSISCQVSTQGVTTTYQMQTYTPQFGQFSRANQDRLARLGRASQQTRKKVRDLFARQRRNQVVATRAALGFNQNLAHAVRQQTPHDAIYATAIRSDAHGVRTQASHATIDEMFANIRGDSGVYYRNTAGMSLEGLYHPFSMATGVDPSGTMPGWEAPDTKLAFSADLKKPLDPLRDSDVDILVNGEVYDSGVGLHRLKVPDSGQFDYDHARGVGFRFPQVGVGWGLELRGKPIPNSAAFDASGNPLASPPEVHLWDDTFVSGVQTRPESWKAGPLLVHWDSWRKGWTVPTNLRGNLLGPLATDGNSSVLMSIKVKGQEVGKVATYCDLGGPTLASGTRVEASYFSLENRWYISAAACSGT